jgi:hypothetical protein
MSFGNPLQKKLIRELNGTRRSLREVCEDLGIDYDELTDGEVDLGIEQCTHCNLWSTKLIPDLDFNPICSYCVDLIGM